MKLSDPIFADVTAAREHLERTRWPNGPICPHCGVVNEATYVGGKAAREGCYQCNACREQFSVMVGTVFERSKVPLNKWLLASFLMASSKKGISAHQIGRSLGVTYKTAWFMCHRLRAAMAEPGPAPIGGKGKVVEADEAYLGGKEKNKHRNKRAARGGPSEGKQSVVTLVERGGFARSFHVANVTSRTLGRIIFTNADRRSHLMTDGAQQYPRIGAQFANFSSVNHATGEYVRDDAHSNTVESYFAVLKRGVYGTFHHVSEAHLNRYLAEFDFRYNTRSALGITDSERSDELLRGIAGKRLTYRRTGEAANA
jgi:transposase-like protein